MNGLAKVAWTRRKINENLIELAEVQTRNAKELAIDTEDAERYLNHLRNKYNIDVQSKWIENGGFYSDPSISKVVSKVTNYLNKKTPGVIEKNDSLAHFKGYDPSKDGLVLSNKDTSTFTHELGHAIDHKKNPLLGHLNSISRGIRDLGPITGITTAAGATLSDEEENQYINTLEGAGVGAITGAGVVGIPSLLINRSENAANRYGEQIIRETNDPEVAEKIIQRGKLERKLAKNTYTLNSLRNLKRSLIGAGIGAGVGLGLNTFKHKKEEAAE